jgi:CubicO group peptidase (beta-lactamase class C family)
VSEEGGAGMVVNHGPAGFPVRVPRSTNADGLAAMLVRHVSAGGRPAVVAVRMDGEERCYRASSDDVRVGLSTWFPIGSLTKVFTGSLFAALARSGAARAGEPVSAFFPPRMLPELWARVSLEDLVTHASGLPASPGNLDGSPWDPYAGWGGGELIEAMRTARPRARGQYRYSNFGYAVLAECLSRRSGLSYQDALSRYLGQPLDLPVPSAGPPAEPAGAARPARPAGPADGRVPGPVWSFGAMTGAGGLWSCLRDLLCWSAALADPGTRRRHRWIGDAQSPRREAARGDRCGYGWHIRRTGRLEYLYATGAVSCSCTWLVIDPETAATTVGWAAARPTEAARITADVIAMFAAGSQDR